VSIKDDFKRIKKELSGDEKVLVSAFKLETLYKKHKLKIWTLVSLLIFLFVGTTVNSALNEVKLEDANKAFLVLQTKADDKEALETLKKKNPALFELYSYAQAIEKKDIKTLEKLSTSSNSIIADASAYTAGVLNEKPVDSELYKELSLLLEAYIAMKENNTKKAKSKLELIDERSPLGIIAGFLKHSTIKAH